MTFREHWSGEADTRLKDYCLVVKAINTFSWEEWIYEGSCCECLCVLYCREWRECETFKQGRVLSTVERLLTTGVTISVTVKVLYL